MPYFGSAPSASALTAAHISDGAITTAKLASGAVNPAAIATDAVTAAEIAANAVDSSELVAGAVDRDHLDALSVLSFRGCMASRGTSQAIADATITTVTWDNTVFDTDSVHSEVTNPSRLTVPSGVTQIRIVVFYYIAWSISKAQGVHYHASRLLKNGAFHAYGNYYYLDCGAANYGYMFGAEWPMLTVTAGDYFETAAQQNTGYAANIGGGGDAGDGGQGSHVLMEIFK